MADGDELRCEAAPSTRAAGEPVDERARGGRCTRRAEVYLFNGSRSQGKACGECGRRLAKEFKFIELRPIT